MLLLTELDLSSFNTNNVIDMNMIFFNCNNLKRVLINKINARKIKEKINNVNFKI